MKIYIGYKYTNHKNRRVLISDLEKIDKLLIEMGHETFILGRDIRKWKHVNLGSLKLIPIIYKNMKQCDLLLAFVDSCAFSKGLFIEAVISKLLQRRSVMFLKNIKESTFFRYLFNASFQISNIKDITKEKLI